MRRLNILLTSIILTIFFIWKIMYLTKLPRDYNEPYYPQTYFKNYNPAPLRVVHLDLKGAPPKMSYLKEILPIISASGGNALLIEYEDMFPYEGLIRNVSAVKAYSRNQINEFLSLCDYYGIEVIPLVQTFGHMEFVLKLQEFQHLRELNDNPQEICPSNSDSLKIISEMLSQVLALHKKIKRIHIGCDEVFNLNVCANCMKLNTNSRDVFLDHIKTISRGIKSTHPKITVLIWDDMLRSWPASYIDSTNLNKYVEPVIWIYGTEIKKLIPLSYWYWYFKHFQNIWIAGAFKGATNEMAILPNVSLHFENQKSWLKFISKHVKPQNTVVGYVLTGWSRYDHFASLCELLPTAIPSLILNLLFISSTFKQQEDVMLSYNEILKCNLKNSFHDIIQLKNTEYCSFPGQELIPLMLKLINYRSEIKILFERLYETNSWMTSFHLKRFYINPIKLKLLFSKNQFYKILKNFSQFSSEIELKLKKYYDKETIEEWFQEHVEFYLNKLEFLRESFEKSLYRNTWQHKKI